MLWKIALLTILLLGGDDALPKGRLVVVGGGKTSEEIRLKALALAGGPGAKVVVVPQASSDPLAGQRTAAWWQEVGATNVVVLEDLSDRETALAQVRSADLIWMRGGSQARLMKALKQGGIAEAIRDRYRDGAIVGGTSAGAAVMSDLMIDGYADFRKRVARTAPGLGLWPEVIVDQHFAQRKRLDRLKGAVRSRPELLGVGIDESTAVLVSGRQFEVVGPHQVVVLDARKPAPKEGPAEPVEPTPPAEKPVDAPPPADMATHVLKAGMKYHLDKGPLPIESASTR